MRVLVSSAYRTRLCVHVTCCMLHVACYMLLAQTEETFP